MARRGFAGFLKHFTLPVDVPIQPAESSHGEVVSVQSHAILLSGLPSVRQGQLVQLRTGQLAWVVALLKNYVGAVVLSRDLPTTTTPVTVGKSDLRVKVGEMGAHYSSFPSVLSEKGQDLLRFLRMKMPFPASRPVLQWLQTGYFHIDLFTPLAYGQFITFTGKRNTGKTTVAVNTIKRHLMAGEQNRAVYVGTSGYRGHSEVLRLLEDEEIKGKLAVYTPGGKDGLVGQFLSPYAALMNAVHLRDSGYNVLFILNDALNQAQTCITAFSAFQPHFSPLGFINLLFDHCKIRKTGSLTSILILNENTEDVTTEYRVVNQHLDSVSDRSILFREGKGPLKGMLPSLDFTEMRDRVASVVQWPIYRVLAGKLGEILGKVKEERSASEGRNAVGLYTPPWDQYLLLDSRYFLKLMQCERSLSPQELLLFTQFQVYIIENELSSTFRPEIPEVRREFFSFIKDIYQSKVLDILRNPEKIVDPQDIKEAADVLNTQVNEPFYRSLKMKGMVKDFREDYDELIIGSAGSEIAALDRSQPTGIKPREFFKETLEELGITKKK